VKVLVVMPEPPYLEGGAAGRCNAGLLMGLQADEQIGFLSTSAKLPSALDGALRPGISTQAVSVPEQGRLEASSNLLRRPLGQLSRDEFGDDS
jgi:hypothetical protein